MRNKRISLSSLILFIFLISMAGFVSGDTSPDLTGQVFQATGTVHIDGDPVGMEIALDGKTAGQVDESGVLIIDSVPVGEHTLTASSPDFITKEVLVNVPDGLPAEVRVNLEKETQGTLIIESTPPNVQVFVDDLYKGITPVTMQVLTGSHDILLTLTGYEDWRSTVNVTADRPAEVSGTLVRIPASPTPTPQGGHGMIFIIVISGICCLIASQLQGRYK